MLIPARDEAGSVGETVTAVTAALESAEIPYEVVVIDDASSDATSEVVERIAAINPLVRCYRSPYEPGFGRAIRAGLERADGDAVAITMADLSDDPADLVRYHRLLEDGWECAFGSRFLPGSRLTGYPRGKLVLNRLANWLIRALFRHGYGDTTNAFKAYSRGVIEAIQPLRSTQFELTVEMPLKAIASGHSYKVIPISWTNRSEGASKFVERRLAARYASMVLSVWLDHRVSRRGSRRAAGAPLGR